MTTEKKLIDVSQVINKMQACIDESQAPSDSLAVIVFGSFMDALKKEPVVDAVEVVRCKDCIRRTNRICPMETPWHKTSEDAYCSYGERKDNAKRNEN